MFYNKLGKLPKYKLHSKMSKEILTVVAQHTQSLTVCPWHITCVQNTQTKEYSFPD